MSIFDAVRVAGRAIVANGLRSFLTILGMVIGVGSVIVLIAVGQGAQKGVQEQIRALGQDLIFIKPGGAAQAQRTNGPRLQATLTLTDAEAIVSSGIPGIEGVAGQLDFNVTAVAGDASLAVTLIGTTHDYIEVRGGKLSSGGFLTATEVEDRKLAIVLGADVAEALFPGAAALGQAVRVSLGNTRFDFTVVGVAAPRGGDGSQDKYVFVPVTVVRSRFGPQRSVTGEVQVTQINVKSTPKADKATLVAGIEELLLAKHAVTTPDFSIQTQDDLLGTAGDVSKTLSILLGSIAGISLVVGGIGVMNIMLVSVTERTREIGIRRAVGARQRDIIVQFVTEALVLCLVGGALGVAVGVGLAVGLDGRQIAGQEMTTLVQPWSIAVAFAVAAGIGAVSGSYPAIRASKLDPITALRSN